MKVLFAIQFLVMVFALMFAFGWRADAEVYRQSMELLEKSQNVMVWQMDESCYNQIKNSPDNINIQLLRE